MSEPTRAAEAPAGAPWRRTLVRATRAAAAPTARTADLVVAAAVVLALVVTVTMLGWPLGYDQGIFASVGAAVARGGAPYVDAWDVKGPVVFWVGAAIRLAFGPHAWGWRLVDIAIALACAVAVARLLAPRLGRRSALLAAAAWPVAVAAQTWDETLQLDLWTGAALLAVVAPLARTDAPRTRDLVLAGATLGLLVMIKPVFGAFALVPVIMLAVRARSVRGAVAPTAIVAAAAIVSVGMQVAVLVAQGALGAAWATYVRFNLDVYAPGDGGALLGASAMLDRLRGLVAWLATPHTLVLVVPATLGAVRLVARDRVLGAGVVAWTAIGIALVLLQNKFWPYHWQVVLPALLLLVATGLHALLVAARTDTTGVLGPVAVASTALVVGAWAIDPLRDVRRSTLHALGLIDDARRDAALVAVSETSPAAERAAAAWVRARTAPDEPFFHWSVNGALAFLADRPHLVRFHNKREVLRASGHPVTEGFRAEVLAALRARPPRVLLLGEGLGRDRTTILPPLAAVRAEYPALAAVIEAAYVRDTVFGELEGWVRRDAAARVGRR